MGLEDEAHQEPRASEAAAGQQRGYLLEGAVPYPRVLILLALAAVVVGRGLSQALPGTAIGIDRLIGWVQLVGAHLSQFAAMLCVLLCGRLVLVILALKQGGVALRVITTIAALSASCLVLLASLTQARFSPTVIAVVSLSVLCALVGTGVSLLRSVEKRAIGLILLSAALSAGLHSLARFIAFTASDRADASLFGAAQLITTAGFAFELACLSSCFLWLISPNVPWLRALSALLIVCSPALALAADQLGTWQRILRGTLEQLGSHPDPWLPAWLVRSVEISGLSAAAVAFAAPQRRTPFLLVASLAVLARSSLDIPLGATFLVCALLVAQLPLPSSHPASEPLKDG